VIRIQLNGEARQFPAGTTVAQLLSAVGAATGRVAVERNLEVVPRAEHATQELAEGDVVEVVTFVGGGA
jgi:sulfur carrier protein